MPMRKNEKRKNVIAVCCATLRERSVLEPMNAICQKANELGFYVQIFQSFEEIAGHQEIYDGEECVFEFIDYDITCGVIIFSERIKDQEVIKRIADRAHSHNIPVVSFDGKQEDCISLTFEYADAFEQIVRHLVEHHKFRKFFIMAGMQNNSFTEERLDAIKRVFLENDIEFRNEDVAYGQFWDYPTKLAMERFFESGRELPEAFISMNDTMATVIVDELQKRGIRVPEDVVVTGFDGIYLADYIVPKLTTAKQQLELAGEKTVEAIYDCIKGKNDGTCDISVPFKMLVRESCGCHNADAHGVTANLRDLYDCFETSKRFGGFMDEMSRKMISNINLKSFVKEAEGYANFVDSHNHVYICIYKDFLKNDEDFYYTECFNNPDLLLENDRDMVVITDGGITSDHSLRMHDFCGRDMLPNIDEFLADVKNIIIAPIHSGDDVYGHMIMDYKIGDKNSYESKVYVNKISNILFLIKQQSMLTSSNRELIRTKTQLEEMYITDPMTGIYNRRGFYQKYDELKSLRQGGKATLISVDLDDLKIINDTYGHTEGDFAIKTLGEALRELVGSNGIYARFGGDEFVALIFDSEFDDNITEHLYEKISECLIRRKEEENKPYNIKCSIGAVQTEWNEKADMEQLINSSDRLLYHMKRIHHEGDNDRRNREA